MFTVTNHIYEKIISKSLTIFNCQFTSKCYRFGIITCIFLPMSFITGLLGINVGGIPFSSSPYGFLIACLTVLALAFGQWWLFRRLRWV